MNHDLTYEEAKELLDYDPETGFLRWRYRSEGWFPNGGWASWNTHYAGCVAGSRAKNGRVTVILFRTHYKAHRLAWLLHHGKWPERQLDHIDGDPSNNRISNLREAENIENSRNRGKNQNNTSGFKGAFWHPQRQRWFGQIMHKRRSIYLGLYDTPEEAHAAYCRKAAELHGEFLNTGSAS